MKALLKKASLIMLALVMAVTLAGTVGGVDTEAAAKKPTKITLTVSPSKTVEVGKTVKVSVKSVKPKKASKAVTYKSSNKKIAIVSKKGVVTGKAPGKVKITVTSKKNKKLKKTVKITVTAAQAAAQETASPAPTPSTPDEPDLEDGEISATQLKNDLAGSQEYKILDVRRIESYKEGHIPTAISASVDEKVSDTTTDGSAVDNITEAIADADGTISDKAKNNQKYALICYSGNMYAKAAKEILIGLGVASDNIDTLKDGMKDAGYGWMAKYPNYVVKTDTTKSNFTFDNIITFDNLKADTDGIFTVVDLRSDVEYAAGHMNGAVSAPLRAFDSEKVDAGSELNESTAKENLKNVASDKKKIYVVVCYSGNYYANLAIQYLTGDDFGIESGHIIVLEGGATNSGYKAVKSASVAPVVNEETITMYGVLNGKYLTDSTMHYMVTAGKDVADQSLIVGLCDRVEVAKDLESLKAVSWNSDPEHPLELKDGESIQNTSEGNRNYSTVGVSVAWSGNTNGVPLSETLLKDGSILSGSDVSMAFSNGSGIAESWKSGCIICATSCYAGVVSNAVMPYSGDTGGGITGNGSLSGFEDGTIVKVTISLNNDTAN